MKTAIISDIHGNLLALQAVVADFRAQGADQVVCLGDVAAEGPQPREAVDLLRALVCPVVMGNTDEDLLQPIPDEPIPGDAGRMRDIERWNVVQLGEAGLAYLRTFKRTLSLPLGDWASLMCFHGSSRSNTEVIDATTPDSALDLVLDGHSATVMAGGHTHVQMVRRHRHSYLINPGSVGLPIEVGDRIRHPGWAEYAMVTCTSGGIAIELRRVPYDIGFLVRVALHSGIPHADWWVADWL
ncbi:MAG: protein phosphatase [Chloroflexi bacterium]|nr:protein phosphatase [Chloroflexota bacterium]